MRRTLHGAAAILLLLAVPAAAQQATERFIPLGESPGLSGVRTHIGRVADVDIEARTVALVEGDDRRTVRVTPRTKIWIDRSRFGQSTLEGGFEDLMPGVRVEVRYADPEAGAAADWIKVAPGPGG